MSRGVIVDPPVDRGFGLHLSRHQRRAKLTFSTVRWLSAPAMSLRRAVFLVEEPVRLVESTRTPAHAGCGARVGVRACAFASAWPSVHQTRWSECDFSRVSAQG